MPTVTWGMAFSCFLAVFGVFEWIIYIERTYVTSPFLIFKFAEGDEPICKISFCNVGALILKNSIFCHPKNVAKLICHVGMSRALTSHIVTSSAGHVFEDNIYTRLIH